MARFTIEFGDLYGRNQSINTFRITKVRGRFSLADMHSRPEGSYPVGDGMSAMPSVPGIHMEVDTTKKTARLYDPLSDEPALLRRVNAVMSDNSIGKPNIGPDEESTLQLDDDTLKSLLYELIRKQESGSIRMIAGSLPKKEEVDAMPGFELNDPWNSSGYKPKYKKDQEAYARNLEKVG